MERLSLGRQCRWLENEVSSPLRFYLFIYLYSLSLWFAAIYLEHEFHYFDIADIAVSIK